MKVNTGPCILYRRRLIVNYLPILKFMKYRLMALFEAIRQLYMIWSKWYIWFGICFVWVKILKRFELHNKNLVYYRLNNIGLYIPWADDAYQTIREVFVEDLYKPLTSCKSILDIGAYVWDSALYFAAHGANVVAYEMNPDLHAIALLNTYAENTISMYYGAVVATDTADSYMQRRSLYDNAGTITHTQQWIQIPVHSILDIFNKHDFDGLKMDIEWWEYPIMQTLMQLSHIPFERGIIELHHTKNSVHTTLIDAFSSYLKQRWYMIRFFHNEDSIYARGHPAMQWVQNLFFYKR